MNQILHIFRKDIRRHWPDIVVVLLALAAYAWHELGEWHPREARSEILHQTFLRWLPLVVVLAWSFLIARVVLAESLVGDRQFWVTRPYEWQKLLTAKVLYFVVFFGLPLLLMHAFLLWKAGFSPGPYVLDLLLLGLFWAGMIVLPVMTLAIVSSNMVQFFLAVLGIALSIMGIAILSTRLQPTSSALAELIPEWVDPVLLLAAALTAIVLQYARRRTLQSRLLLFSVGTAVVIISLIQEQNGFLARDYPRLPEAKQLPIQISLDPSVTDPGSASIENNKIPVRIPLVFSGMVENSALSLNGALVDIQASGNMHWNSGWFRMYEEVLPRRQKFNLFFTVDKSFFESVKPSPVMLHIFIALTMFRSDETRRVIATAGDFEAPGKAICSIWPQDASSLHCRAPLRRPSLAVNVLSQESTCPMDEEEKAASLGSSFFDWQRDSDESDLTPVQTFTFSFWGVSWNQGDRRNFLCPGTPLNFQLLSEAQRARSELSIEGIRLVDYQPKEQGPIFGIVSRPH